MATTLPRPSLKDRQRWFLWKRETSIEEIAARDRITVEQAKESIDKMEMWRWAGSFEEVDAEYNHMALELIPAQKKVILDGMKATSWRTNAKGKQVKEVDHTTRMKAAELGKEFAAAAKPKAPGNVVNVQTNVANMGQNGSQGGLSFEQRLREIKAKRAIGQLSAPPPQLEATTMSQAEKIAAEFEEAGIDLEDGDLDELEGEEDDEGDDEDSEENS